jgi:hypothetical protein
MTTFLSAVFGMIGFSEINQFYDEITTDQDVINCKIHVNNVILVYESQCICNMHDYVCFGQEGKGFPMIDDIVS